MQNNFITLQILKKMQEFFAKISLPGVNSFTHDITFENGEISILTTNRILFDFYYKNSFPAVCTNIYGRYLQPGIYLSRALIPFDSTFSTTKDYLAKGHSFKEFISFVEKEIDCEHMYTFSFSLSENDFLQVAINQLHIMKNFIFHYKSFAKQIVSEAKLKKNRIMLPISTIDTINSSLFPYKGDKKMEDAENTSIQSLSILSLQQEKCLKFLISGYSSKEIARQMNLSPRTVEHYLARVRSLLKCKNSKELICRYSHLFSAW